MIRTIGIKSVLATLSLLMVATCASAQEATRPVPASAIEQGLLVELNEIKPSQKGCMMTFVARNELPESISKLSLQLAFFDKNNTVSKVTVLDFRDLPRGKTRVRQFDVAGMACNEIKRLIINDAPVCTGPGGGSCMKNLKTQSNTVIPLEG